MPVTIACKEADEASKIAIDGYQWLREVCSTRLLTSPWWSWYNHPSRWVTVQLQAKGKVIQYIYMYLYTDLLMQYLYYIEWQMMHGWSHTGVWFSWCINHSCHRLHGDCTIERLGNITWDNTVVHTDEWTPYGWMTNLLNIKSQAMVDHSLRFIDLVTGVHMFVQYKAHICMDCPIHV